MRTSSKKSLCRGLAWGMVGSTVGVVGSFVAIMLVPQDIILYFFIYLGIEAFIAVFTLLATVQILLLFLDQYDKLPSADQARVHHVGKRAFRVVTERLKRNEKYRGTVEDVEKILESD